MENSGKRLLIAAALSLIVMLGYTKLFPPAPEKPKAADVAANKAATPPAPDDRFDKTVAPAATPPVVAAAPVAAAATDGGVPSVDAGAAAAPAVATVTDAGVPASDGGTAAASATAPPLPAAPPAPRAAEQTIVLSFPKVKATFTSWGGSLKSWFLTDPKYVRDVQKGEMVPQLADTSELQISFSKDSTYKIPDDAVWTGTKVSDTEVRYQYKSDALEVTKTFTILPNDYIIKLKVDVKSLAKTDAIEQLRVSSSEYQDPKLEVKTMRGRGAIAWRASCQVGDKLAVATPKDLDAGKKLVPAASWGGFVHGFFLMATAPRLAMPGEPVQCNSYSVPGTAGLMLNDLVFPSATLKSTDSISRELTSYYGPTNFDNLAHADAVAGFDKYGFSSVMDFGWFGFIGTRLMWLLQQLYGLCGNWGVAIILLTVLVKIATLYWTTKSTRSMKAMSALAPKMKELQEKYKEDKQKQQVETMALYKQYGVNPLAGCLPMVLQMPIWLALYRMLSSAGEMYLSPFIPGWINDLTAPDPYHVLPVILIITMFAQARLTPQTTAGTQQKIMMYGMPLMFGVASFFFASGLALYIFTNTFLSAMHSIYMNKFDKQSLAIMATLGQPAVVATASKTDVKAAMAKATPAKATTKSDDDKGRN